MDAFVPKTTLRLSDGATLTVGTKACDDYIHQAVFLSFTHADQTEPVMNFELSPKGVDVLITTLQGYANQARFVNGTDLVDYAEPKQVKGNIKPRKTKKPTAVKKKEQQKAEKTIGDSSARE